MLRQHQKHYSCGINCPHDGIGIQLPRHHVSWSNPTSLTMALECAAYLNRNRSIRRSVADEYLSGIRQRL